MSLKQRLPFLRWSVWRMATGVRNITTTGQIGDVREAAAVEYVLKNARAGDVDDVLAVIDRFAYEKAMLINVGDEKGALPDAAVRRADPKLDRGRRQRQGAGRAEVQRVHAPAARQGLEQRRAQGARRVSDLDLRPGAGVGVSRLTGLSASGVHRNRRYRSLFGACHHGSVDVAVARIVAGRGLICPAPPRAAPRPASSSG